MSRPLHPEGRHDLLREKARRESEVRVPPSGWHWQYGWLIILVEHNGVKHYRDTHSRATYEEAVRIRDEELYEDDRYEKAWLIQKNDA